MTYSILTDIQDYLQENGYTVSGDDCFIGTIPADCARGILFRLPLTGVAIDHDIPQYRKTSIQMIVRDADYEEAERRCHELMNALTFYEKELEHYKVTFMLPEHDPITYPRSDSGYREFAVNFQIRFFIL